MTWPEIKAEAFGVFGLKPWDFYRYSYDEYLCLRKGHSNATLDRLHELRLLCFFSAAGNLKKGTKITDIFPLPGERGYNAKMDNTRYEKIKARLGSIKIPELKPKMPKK